MWLSATLITRLPSESLKVKNFEKESYDSNSWKWECKTWWAQCESCVQNQETKITYVLTELFHVHSNVKHVCMWQAHSACPESVPRRAGRFPAIETHNLWSLHRNNSIAMLMSTTAKKPIADDLAEIYSILRISTSGAETVDTMGRRERTRSARKQTCAGDRAHR